MTATQSPAWQNLQNLTDSLTQQPLKSLLNDEQRAQRLQHQLAGMLFDFSKQWVDGPVMDGLAALAEDRKVMSQAKAMLAGEAINRSENRAVLHSTLRNGAPAAGKEIQTQVNQTLGRMFKLQADISSGAWRGYTGKVITDIVHIGIGGSHLGPELVVNALVDHKTNHLRIHFVANIDAAELTRTLAVCQPETTLFIIASKSFGTLETQVNAKSARSWFLERTGSLAGIAKHFVAITTNLSAASEFGLDEANLFPLWDWVGGRFSLWSAVGMPILMSIGKHGFEAFLAGAQEVDQHFSSTPTATNIPLLSALLATWNYNFLGARSLAVLAYDERLKLLPDYLQQLEMESNGKSVNHEGATLDYDTMPVLWGGTGTKGQHAYHQMLHQGTHQFAADFIIVAQDQHNYPEHHNWLLANALGQSQAMAIGHTPAQDEPYKAVAGNHSTTTIVLDTLAPRQLGGLLATYEHKVFCQGAIWDINSFDQWGVELGKRLAEPIYEQLAAHRGQGAMQDLATQHLLDHLKNRK
ncbi:MAG: glucose-6-phosphate isomerase [Pseudomonadaceae bacterium]|nr:glucose-6-phosphate isomerase [Pseudomonadaceae bacterium]